MNCLKLFALSCLSLLLAACVTTPPNPLDARALSDLHIAEYRVEIVPHANLSWLDWTVFQSKAGPDGSQSAQGETSRSQDRAGLEAAVAEQVRIATEAGLAGKLIGKVPAVMVVRVHSVMIPSLLQRATLGGQPFMRADGILIDRASGRTLAAYNDLFVVAYAGQGLFGIAFDATIFGVHAQMKHVAERWVSVFESWLLGPRQMH